MQPVWPSTNLSHFYQTVAKRKSKVNKSENLPTLTAAKRSHFAFPGYLFLKMLNKHSVEGFDAFKAKVEALSKESIPLFVYFSGSKSADGNYYFFKNI